MWRVAQAQKLRSLLYVVEDSYPSLVQQATSLRKDVGECRQIDYRFNSSYAKA